MDCFQFLLGHRYFLSEKTIATIFSNIPILFLKIDWAVYHIVNAISGF